VKEKKEGRKGYN